MGILKQFPANEAANAAIAGIAKTHGLTEISEKSQKLREKFAHLHRPRTAEDDKGGSLKRLAEDCSIGGDKRVKRR